MSKQSLLLVDGDTRSLRVLEVSLRKAGFMVTAALSVQDALDKLELNAPDLIISETTFSQGDGFELRRRVRATPEWSEIPFIFLTAEAAIENKIRGLELGVDDYLTKPIYIKEIITRINILLQKRQRVRFEGKRDGRTRFAGRVQDMPVVDVIQTIEISRKSGVIQFVGERGRQAAIYFRDGRVIDAEAGSLQGEDAVYRLLTWNEGEFEVVFRTVRRREVITMSSQALLMEGMRRLDEWSRLFEQLPPLTHRFEVDTIELAARLGDVPDDNNRILRLFDGKRTLLEVIDASDVGDLECLQAISRLYFEELLLDLDHGKTPRRDTGKSMPLTEVEGPAESSGSGPIAADALASEADEVGETEVPGQPAGAEPAAPAPSRTGSRELAPAQARTSAATAGTGAGGASAGASSVVRAAADRAESRSGETRPAAQGASRRVEAEASGPDAASVAASSSEAAKVAEVADAPRTSEGMAASAGSASSSGGRGAARGGAAPDVATREVAAAGSQEATGAERLREVAAAAGSREATGAERLREVAAAAGSQEVTGTERLREVAAAAGSQEVTGAARSREEAEGSQEETGAARSREEAELAGSQEATGGAGSQEVTGGAGSQEVTGGAGSQEATGGAGLREATGGAGSREATGAAGSREATGTSGSREAASAGLREAAGVAERSREASADDAGDDVGRATFAVDDGELDREVGPLMGGYRPSSLRLIDEAVAAAQAVEPSLFDERVDDLVRLPAEGVAEAAATEQATAAPDRHHGNGVARSSTSEDRAPAAKDDGGAAAARSDVVVPPVTLIAADREESGLRMIGSLGRDRAEASGELAPLGQRRPLRSETARELVTILPRRVTREMPALSQTLAESLPTPTPTSPVLAPRPATSPAVEAPSPALPQPRITLPGTGVRAAPRSRRLLRVVDGRGPGLGAVLLIVLAAVLAGTAVLLRLRRHATPSTPTHQSSRAGTLRDAKQPSPSAGTWSTVPEAAGPSNGASGAAVSAAALHEADVSREGGRAASGGSGERAGTLDRAGAHDGSLDRTAREGPSRDGAALQRGGEARVITGGSQGGVGLQGSVGAGAGAGAQGAAGVRGSAAAPGVGMQGSVGPQGSVGLQGSIGSGAQGVAGARGGGATPGVGMQGSVGAAAGIGAQGVAGVRGGGVAAGGMQGSSGTQSGGVAAGGMQGGGAGRGGSGDGAADAAGRAPSVSSSGTATSRADGADRNAEAKALYDKAHDAMDESNFSRALELAEASLRLRRTARTYLLRAQAEQRLERVDAALASVDAAAQLAPDYSTVWEIRGRILWAARRRDEARAAFEKFLALEPDSPKAASVRRLMNEPR